MKKIDNVTNEELDNIENLPISNDVEYTDEYYDENHSDDYRELNQQPIENFISKSVRGRKKQSASQKVMSMQSEYDDTELEAEIQTQKGRKTRVTTTTNTSTKKGSVKETNETKPKPKRLQVKSKSAKLFSKKNPVAESDLNDEVSNCIENANCGPEVIKNICSEEGNEDKLKKMARQTSKLLEVKTEEVIALKTLFEVLKDFLGDINIEFKQYKDNKTDQLNSNGMPGINNAMQGLNNALQGVNKMGPGIVPVEEGNNAQNIPNTPNTQNELNNANAQAQAQTQTGTNNNEENRDKDTGGIKIVAIDASRTLIIHVKLDAKQFTVFNVSKPIYDVGINLTQLHKLIKSLDKDDILTISIEEDETQMLVLDVENEGKNTRTRNKLKMLDIDKKSYKIPHTKFDVVITMDSTDFHKICKEMSQISEYVEILCKENSITFTCKGDCSEKSTTIDANNTSGINIKPYDCKKKIIVQGIFELKNFVMFSKCSSICNDIKIYMKNNYPIFIRYTVFVLGQILLGLIPINDTKINNNFSDDEEEYSDDDKKITMLK